MLAYWMTYAIQKFVQLTCCWNLKEMGTDEVFLNSANTKSFHYLHMNNIQLLLSHAH